MIGTSDDLITLLWIADADAVELMVAVMIKYLCTA